MLNYLKFIKKVIIFLLPFILLMILPFWAILFGREYYSVDKVIAVQESNPDALFNFCCSNLRREYKEELLMARKPEIISLGTSRVLQFRDFMFTNPSAFTNMGQAIIGASDIEKFGQKFLSGDLKDSNSKSTVKVVLLGLDYQMFNPEFISPDVSTVNPENVFNRFFSILATNWRRLYSFYFNHNFTLTKLYQNSHQNNNMGVIALMTNSGFRSDGSFEYGDDLHSPNHASELAKQLIIAGDNARVSGQYGASISSQALESINNFLILCSRNNIKVIGFMSPQPEAIYNALMSKDDAYKQSFVELPKKLNNIFQQNNFKFYDLSNAKKTLNMSDDKFVDPLHGNEKMYSEILKKLF